VRESRLKQEALVATLEDRTRLAYVRYRGGVDTQLNALDSDRDLFQAQLNLAEIRLNELLSVVQLYKALGGGCNDPRPRKRLESLPPSAQGLVKLDYAQQLIETNLCEIELCLEQVSIGIERV